MMREGTVVSAMLDSPFAKLPPEIRNNIYELALTQTGCLKISDLQFINNNKRLCLRNNRKNPLALTETCKQIRNEATLIFFASNRFCIALPTVQDIGARRLWSSRKLRHTLQEFLKNIGPQNEAALRNVVVFVPPFQHTKPKLALRVWKPLLTTMQRIADRNPLLNPRVVTQIWHRYVGNRDMWHFVNLAVNMANATGDLERFLRKTKKCHECRHSRHRVAFLRVFEECIEALGT